MNMYNWLDNRLTQYCDQWRITLTDEQYAKAIAKLDRKMFERIDGMIMDVVRDVTEEDEQ